MRVLRLELKAFGPFTDKVLDFGGEAPGLHVVHGPNEAGKSSTLRALTALLYGFPERTRDNFVHPNDQLLVAGLLENGQGEGIYLARRKKRKADLLDADGNPVEPAVLAALLHGIDRENFGHLFGLDHETLVAGGTAILQEKGSAGTTLFAAGTGTGSLQRLLDELREESDAIFKGRASRPALNAALREFAGLKSEIGRLTLSSREYREHDSALRKARRELEGMQARRSELGRERHRLDRLGQALPPLALRRELRARLAALGEVRPLPGDFAARRRESEDRQRTARQRLTAARGQREDLGRKADQIALNTGLLDQAETIGLLTQRLGEFRKGQTDRPRLAGQRDQARSEAAKLLGRIRPDLEPEGAEELRPLLRRRRNLQELGGRLPLLEEKLAGARQRLDKLEREREANAVELEKLGASRDRRELDAAVAGAQALGDIDRDQAELEERLAGRRGAFSRDLFRLGLWSGTPEELLELPLPLAETVESFARDFRRGTEEADRLRRRREELAAEDRSLALEIDTIDKTGEVPTENELRRLREHRDRGWELLRRQWLAGEDVAGQSRDFDPGKPLPDAFEDAIGRADATADRLRREAERVHRYAHLVGRREAVAEETQDLADQEARLARRLADLEQRWREHWRPCGIDPLGAEEMSGWLGRLEPLRVLAGRIAEDREAIANGARRRQDAAATLRTALERLDIPVPPGETLGPLLQAGRDEQERETRAASRRQTLQDALEGLERERRLAGQEADQAGEALAGWRRQWRGALADLGLKGEEAPGEVADFFEGLTALMEQLDLAGDLHRRIAGIDGDAGRFSREVRELAERVAPELATLPTDQAVERLGGLLARNREQEGILKNCREGMERADAEIREATAELEAAGVQLEKLQALAGCTRQEDLEEAERLWQEKRRLEERLEEEERRLLQLAEGGALEDLERAVADLDADALPGRLRSLDEQLGEVEARIGELSETVGEERTELARMDGRPEAALKAEQAEAKLAEIRRLAERYARLRVAARVLEDEIERYRAENQDPVLKLAGGYFAELTLGSFEGLRTDVDDRGEPVIVGLRPGGNRLGTDAMSAGTRDQLFLALRLASLEHRLEKSEALPFVIDDILVNFDEARAEATLRALARLGEKNQVILFTHHRQLAEAVAGVEPARLISLA